MSTKKDLTRIEDIGEFFHQQDDEEISSFETPEGEEEATSFDAPPAFEESSPFEEPSTFEESLSFEDSPTFESSESFEDSSASFEDNSTFSSAEFSSEEELPQEEPDFSASLDNDNQTDESITNPVDEVPFTPEPEPTPEPKHTSPVYTPEPAPEANFQSPENFDEVKKFAESTSFTGMSAEGNPSFSVLLKNVRFVEDVSDIISLLRELNLLSDSEDQTRSRLMRGHLLVPRISEYAAIFLAHKLRRFDIDIQVGLSDEIHPPKHHEAPEVGLVSKLNLYQNQSHHFKFDNAHLELSQIIVAATPTLEGYQVVRYLGVASEHQMLEGQIVEDEISDDVPRFYHELAQKLKAHALKAHANAVVGLNYQLTPLPSEYGHSIQRYRLSCTGNLVWVKKI